MDEIEGKEFLLSDLSQAACKDKASLGFPHGSHSHPSLLHMVHGSQL